MSCRKQESPRFTWILTLVVPAAFSCADLGGTGGVGGSGQPAGSGGTAGAGGTAGSSGSGGSTGIVTQLITCLAVLPDGQTQPLEGVEICELDTDNCVMSNEEGRAALNLPRNQKSGYTTRKEGYGSFLTAFVTDDTSFVGRSTGAFYTHEQLASVAAELGVPYDEGWTTGVFGTSTWPPDLPGVTMASVSGEGRPFYLDQSRQYTRDADASAAIDWWPSPLGTAAFVGFTEGEHEVEFGGSILDCASTSLRWGWPGSGPNRVTVPVRVGHISWGGMNCEEP